MKRLFSSFILLFVLSLPISFFGQKTAKENTASLLDAYLTRMSAFGYSGSVIVEKNGRIILQKGYGFANKEKRIPVTVSTPFSVASISKQFTAAAILKLEEQGKLSLNDPITKFIKAVPEDKKSITVYQLLTHTSGIGNNYAGTKITNRDEAVSAILSQPLDNPVGKKYEYSNDGYDLAGALVEIVSGQNLKDFIRRNLFEPAGMKTAGFVGEKDFWKNIEVAHPYNYYLDRLSPQFDTEDWDGRGSADVIVSADDLYKWELSLRQDKVLSASIKQQMFSPQSALENGWHYGFGWFIIPTDRGTTEFYHGGSDVPRGYTASYSRYPGEKTTIIMLINTMTDDIGFLRAVKDGIVNITFDKKVEIPPPFVNVASSQLKKYIGTYQSDSGDKFIVQDVSGDLMIGADGQEAINSLTTPDDELRKKFDKFNQTGKDFIAKMISDPSSIPEIKASFDSFKQRRGNYRSFEISGTYPVSTQYNTYTTFVKMHYEKGDEIIRLVHRGDNTYSLTGNLPPALIPLKLQKAENFVAFYPLLQKTVYIEFKKDKNGKITGMILDNGKQKTPAKKSV